MRGVNRTIEITVSLQRDSLCVMGNKLALMSLRVKPVSLRLEMLSFSITLLLCIK